MSLFPQALAALSSFVFTLTAHSQDFPAKPVRLVVTVAPGGGLDALCRATAQRLSDAWGHPVIVENRAGGQSVIGYEYVSKSAPDGYTLLCSGASQATYLVTSKNLSYDPGKDFAPVTGLVAMPVVLAVNPSLAAKSIVELIELAKTRPGQINYASFGVGTNGHLMTELLQSMAGIKMTHIPYKGGAPALAEVVAGHSQMLLGTIALVLPQWKAGKVRVLAVSSAKRLVQYPDVPTISESGVPGFEGSAWFGLNAPRNTPRGVINRINTEIHGIYADSGFRARNLDPFGYVPIVNTPDWFAEYLRQDALKWAKVIRDANVTFD